MHYLLNGHSLVLEPELCSGCGRCMEVCPHAVFAIADRKALIAHRENCMECGACRMNCPTQAIEVSAGVGCAAAIISSMRGNNKGCVSCDCG
jgi:NAD-dependent dihydropyrimidine dehydrogenase PreA subunit